LHKQTIRIINSSRTHPPAAPPATAGRGKPPELPEAIIEGVLVGLIDAVRIEIVDSVADVSLLESVMELPDIKLRLAELVIGSLRMVDEWIDDPVDRLGKKCDIEAADGAVLVTDADDTSMTLTLVGDGEDSLDISMSTVVVIVVATVVRVEWTYGCCVVG
jgi:hypothetical protein